MCIGFRAVGKVQIGHSGISHHAQYRQVWELNSMDTRRRQQEDNLSLRHVITWKTLHVRIYLWHPVGRTARKTAEKNKTKK
jgi:hypothetical protein